MNNQDIAKHYLSIGLSIIPVGNDKKPLIPWLDYQTKYASVDDVDLWFKKFNNPNIGIVTGKISNICVVDCDSEAAIQTIETLLPESIVTPIANTPRGGKHYYFTYIEGLVNRANVLEKIDIRTDGGFIVAPPSMNGNGKGWAWIDGIDICNTKTAALPYALQSALNNNIKNSLYEALTPSDDAMLNSVTFNLNKGYRDQTLFHVAHCLIKGGANPEETRNVLDILAEQCNPKFPKTEIVTKINSVLERANRKDRNIKREVEDFVAVTSGYFSVKDSYSLLNIVTSKDKTNVRVVLNKLKHSGIIEKHPTQDAIYRKVETNFDFITFDEHEAPEVEYPVKLPLGLNDLAEISQGNIILVAGEFNAGKTSFLLNILNNNKSFLPIRYITSEMSKSEFKKRFASFGLPLSFWMQDEMTDYVKKSSDFHAAIRPEALNIIDYMEFRDSDYTKGAEYLTRIHDALTTGIAIVAVQKKEGLRMPRSGDMIIEKPRLAISLSKYPSNAEYPQGIAEVLKCKMPKLGKIDGKKLRFELQRNGSKFHVLNEWGYLKF